MIFTKFVYYSDAKCLVVSFKQDSQTIFKYTPNDDF